MKKSFFNYQLPPELIAKYPLENRSSSRLLVLNQQGQSQSLLFEDLFAHIQPNDLLVLNDTKVLAARLYAKKQTGGAVEILLEKLLDEKQAVAQIKASKSLKQGSQLITEQGSVITVLGRQGSFFIIISEQPLLDILSNEGHMPLPPYIDRSDEQLDKKRYQTVFGTELGAVAAPTAGLHFTKELLERIKSKGCTVEKITLHVGAGTYQPMRAEALEQHEMHSEWIQVSDRTCQAIAQTKSNGGRVIAVGTTVVRSLETAFNQQHQEIQPFSGETDIFLYPGKAFDVVDMLVTNFHLPESTLIMLVCAFSGYQNMMQAYQQAIAEKYRFFSYGDAMLLYKNPEAMHDIPNAKTAVQAEHV